MIELDDGTSLSGEDKINVILGKNGSGKSTLLRRMDQNLSRNGGCVRYITPERGGDLIYDGNIETNRAHNPTWLFDTRRKNRYEQFRQSSVAEFRSLETLVLRSIENDPALRASAFRFDTEIQKINEVLDRVELRRSDGAGFDILRKDNHERASPSDLSSGESELISLAIEIFYFSYLSKQERYRDTSNWLLLDEPDVHLHPDLQYRLMQLLVNCMDDANGRVAIATHSTVILSSLCAAYPDTRIGLKAYGEAALALRPASDALKAILPMFGAHPLSNIFNQKPPLILEGEDDERIWQTAVRSSQGRIAVYPCVAGDVQSMNEYETAAAQLIDSVYDNAKAFSLRDRDDDPYEIDDVGSVVRARLNCRAAENLLVTDDVLHDLGTDWPALCAGLEKWIKDNEGHVRYGDAVAFRDSDWNRRDHRLKELRMIIVGVSGSTKPWEVAVGQSIARLHERRFHGPDCLEEYLGPAIIDALGLVS